MSKESKYYECGDALGDSIANKVESPSPCWKIPVSGNHAEDCCTSATPLWFDKRRRPLPATKTNEPH